MEPSDITIEVLKGIRDEVSGLRTEVGALRTELHTEVGALRTELHTEVGALRAELTTELKEVQRRQTEMEVRVATELVGVAHAVIQVRDLLREDRGARERALDHERRIVALEKKVG